MNEGRWDLFDSDLLVCENEGESDMPVLFPPERVHPDRVPRIHGANRPDDELGFSGRPDFIRRCAGGAIVPLESKEPHLVLGWRSMHLESPGRAFDTLGVIAERRLVHAACGVRPPYGIVLPGDWGPTANTRGGSRSHTATPRRRAALTQIRTDRARSPVPGERNGAGCEPNRDGACRYSAARYVGPHRAF